MGATISMPEGRYVNELVEQNMAARTTSVGGVSAMTIVAPEGRYKNQQVVDAQDSGPGTGAIGPAEDSYTNEAVVQYHAALGDHNQLSEQSDL